jgi:hypothetical protein
MSSPYTNPYQPPSQFGSAFAPPPNYPAPQPAVWTWYCVYCGAMALLYLLVMVLGIAFLAMPAEMLEGEDSPEAVRFQGVLFAVMGLPFFLFYAAAPFLPRAKWAWIYGIVAIGIGLTSCCTLPFSIMLLIQWIKPDVKAWFNAL